MALMDLNELSKLVGVVSKHDPLMQAKLSAIFDRRVEPRKRTATVLPIRKGRKT